MNSHHYIDPLTAYCKRLFDLLLAGTGLLIMLPLFPVIALAIKINSPGPIFFKQLRIGKATADRVALFEMIKFRTMVHHAERESGATWARPQDPRTTAIGVFLRKTRLDEVPQFINVLKGEMSVIGPRPERPGFYQNLENNIPFFVERTFGVSPGITGLAQVNQGYDTCIDDVRTKVGFDHSYGLALGSFTGWLRMDAIIVLRTLTVMILGRGQ